MRQGGLRYEIWCIRAFGAPILERRTEPMDCDVIADLTQLPGHRHNTDRPPLPHPSENEVVLPDLNHLLENGDSTIRQWDAVLPSGPSYVCQVLSTCAVQSRPLPSARLLPRQSAQQ